MVWVERTKWALQLGLTVYGCWAFGTATWSLGYDLGQPGDAVHSFGIAFLPFLGDAFVLLFLVGAVEFAWRLIRTWEKQ